MIFAKAKCFLDFCLAKRFLDFPSKISTAGQWEFEGFEDDASDSTHIYKSFSNSASEQDLKTKQFSKRVKTETIESGEGYSFKIKSLKPTWPSPMLMDI